ncbi:MAG TPA: hypothetical protein VFV27_04595 [Nevskiaceae bacterium]|nr:hypothetical protein [Nevskiaceae bacterium]
MTANPVHPAAALPSPLPLLRALERIRQRWRAQPEIGVALVAVLGLAACLAHPLIAATLLGLAMLAVMLYNLGLVLNLIALRWLGPWLRRLEVPVLTDARC